MNIDGIFDEDELAAAAVTADASGEAAGEASTPPEPAASDPATEPKGGDPSAEAEATDEQKAKLVPHEALHAERVKRQRIEAELAAERSARQREAERITRIEEMLRPKQEAKPLPPINEDPVAHIAAQGQTIEQVRTMLEQQAQQVEEQRQMEALHAALSQSEQQFRETAPDYDAAADHLYQSRLTELTLMGVPEQQARAAISQEIFDISRRTLMAGRNPAEAFYQLATTRGYRPATAQAPAADPAAKVAAINAGQKAARSLGATQGAAPAADLNVKALLDMSDEEFAKLDPAQFRRIAGG